MSIVYIILMNLEGGLGGGELSKNGPLADSFIELPCPSVCLRVCMSLFMRFFLGHSFGNTGHMITSQASHWSQHWGSKLGASTQQYLCWSTLF